MVPEEKLLEIEIEPGMRDGQEYPFVAEGIQCQCVSLSDQNSCSVYYCGRLPAMLAAGHYILPL